jgi:protein-S-isoprenylcysteine O-methyltransferase Ste14
VALLWIPNVPLPVLGERFLPRGAWWFWIGAATTAGGLLFSVWARRHLGANWSQAVTVKEGHELITSGPYALVRHPIYTAGCVFVWAGALAHLSLSSAALSLVILAGALTRMRLEERSLLQRYPEYRDYAARTSRMVPGIF